MSENDVVQLRQVVLERMQVGAVEYLSDFLFGVRATVQEQGDMFSRRLCFTLRGYFYGKTVESHTIEWPADWRESLKDRWLPAWAKRRWPVRYTRKTISLIAAWPTLRAMVPEHEPRLIVTLNGASIGTYPEYRQ